MPKHHRSAEITMTLTYSDSVCPSNYFFFLQDANSCFIAIIAVEVPLRPLAYIDMPHLPFSVRLRTSDTAHNDQRGDPIASVRHPPIETTNLPLSPAPDDLHHLHRAPATRRITPRSTNSSRGHSGSLL